MNFKEIWNCRMTITDKAMFVLLVVVGFITTMAMTVGDFSRFPGLLTIIGCTLGAYAMTAPVYGVKGKGEDE